MNKQVKEYLILRSNNIFLFKIPNPEFLRTDNLNSAENQLFIELASLDFDHSFEVVLFKTLDGRIGVIGEEFSGWYPSKSLPLSLKFLVTTKIEEIHLLNMKPARGSGFGTISLMPGRKEIIFFELKGIDRDWDFNFRKTDKLLIELSKFLDCNEIKILEGYNA
jgi:hypothetical protein